MFILDELPPATLTYSTFIYEKEPNFTQELYKQFKLELEQMKVRVKQTKKDFRKELILIKKLPSNEVKRYFIQHSPKAIDVGKAIDFIREYEDKRETVNSMELFLSQGTY
ncbi:hypothetical protein K502DRAFT_326604 [Neoconidiobolus thromboides FSU 785]|nr:hypothetical protein K502DRAFT_326604 [Neoconidiobolus thromboides FSU 785]